MKKFLVMVAVAMMTVVNANAQSAGEMFLKPMVGGTLSSFRGSDAKDVKMKLGLVGGAEFGYFASDNFAVTAGALVAMQGSGVKDDQFTKDQSSTLTYLNIPVLANYYLAPGLAVKAGIQPGFLLSCKVKGSDYVNGVWVDYDGSSTDGMKKLDFAIPFGLSYEFSDIVIDARYNLSLTKIDDKLDAKVYNSVIILTVGYKIPF